ncbi:MAG: hypothetical protein L6Q92_09395 [Phycisphaerae bacterium]|nr:hypothetical protein [Phycisphaerae bacterium]
MSFWEWLFGGSKDSGLERLGYQKLDEEHARVEVRSLPFDMNDFVERGSCWKRLDDERQYSLSFMTKRYQLRLIVISDVRQPPPSPCGFVEERNGWLVEFTKPPTKKLRASKVVGDSTFVFYVDDFFGPRSAHVQFLLNIIDNISEI